MTHRNWWFRMKADAVDNPKVQMLSDSQFRTWVNLLCIGCPNNGILPRTRELSFRLRKSEEEVISDLAHLQAVRLIDRHKCDGPASLHDWAEHQCKSTSADRMQRKRLKDKQSCDVTCDVTVTSPEASHVTQLELEKEREESIGAKGCADAPPIAPSSVAKTYAYVGSVIRLTEKGYADWKAAFPALDLMAELVARDAWLASLPENDTRRRKWFVSTSQHFANRNMEANARTAALGPRKAAGGFV